jgi:putative intracellular protease/amidase
VLPALAALDPGAALCASACLGGIEDELRKLGANYVMAGLWRGLAIRDGSLITGQQNFSGAETAELLAAALGV